MADVQLEKCPNCGGDLKSTKITMVGDEKRFVCRNCRKPLGIVKE